MNLIVVILAVLVFSESVAAAQTVLLRGTILDPSGAVIPAANVKVTQGGRVAGERKSDATGNFSFDLPAGDYRLQVSAADFRTYVQNVRVTPNMRPLSVSLVLAGVNAAVDVAPIEDQVTLDEDVNLTSTSISGDTIKALPEDDDALLAQLQALAAGSGAAGSTATRLNLKQIAIEILFVASAHHAKPAFRTSTASNANPVAKCRPTFT